MSSSSVQNISYKVVIKYMRFNCVAKRISKSNFSFEDFLGTLMGSYWSSVCQMLARWKLFSKDLASDNTTFYIKQKPGRRLWIRNSTPEFLPADERMKSAVVLLFNDPFQGGSFWIVFIASITTKSCTALRSCVCSLSCPCSAVLV